MQRWRQGGRCGAREEMRRCGGRAFNDDLVHDSHCLVVAKEDVEGTPCLVRLPRELCEECEDGELVVPAVQLVSHLHAHRCAPRPLIPLRMQDASQSQHAPDCWEISVQVPDGDQPLRLREYGRAVGSPAHTPVPLCRSGRSLAPRCRRRRLGLLCKGRRGGGHRRRDGEEQE